MTPKELKKFAKACREAGIKTFKNADVEFTLSEDMVMRNFTKLPQKGEVGKNSNSIIEEAFKSDNLTDEQLLMWSAAEFPEGAN